MTTPPPRIGLDLHADGRVIVAPLSYLGGALFATFRLACGQHGARYDSTLRASAVLPDLVPGLAAALRAAGLQPVVSPALAEILNNRAAETRAGMAAATERLTELTAHLAERGLSLYPFQVSGVAWLEGRRSALLADEMGCVDGESIIQVNRAGKGFKMRLSDLYKNMAGIRPETGTARNGSKSARGGPKWNPAIPTKCKALCNGVLLQHRIKDVLDKGTRPVLLIRLKSGKSIRITETPITI